MTKYFHPAGEFVGRNADARGAARGRDVGVPTKRNSAIASNGARTVKMWERALKSLRDHGPSKLKVPGSSPGGVANVYNGLDVRQGSGPLPAGVKLRPFSSRREFSATVQSSFVDVLDGPLVDWCIGSVESVAAWRKP